MKLIVIAAVVAVLLGGCESIGQRYMPGDPAWEAMRKQKFPKCKQFNYPEYSVVNEQQGVTVLDLIISEDGTVLESAIAESSGHNRLDEQTILVVKNCEFEKLQNEGRPTKYRTKFKMHWQLWV